MNDTPDSPPADPPAPVRPRRVLKSHELLLGEREVWIEHGDEIYRLRLTSRGKLYLTK